MWRPTADIRSSLTGPGGTARRAGIAQRGKDGRMRIPRILFVIPPLLAGVYIPALAHPAKPPPTVLGMRHEKFASDSVTVKCGQTLTMANDSNWVHIIG